MSIDAHGRVTAPPALAVRLQAVTKVYDPDRRPVTALRELSLDIPAGSFTAIMGPSGSGKSTLMQCAAGLDSPTSGAVVVGDVALTTLKATALTEFRRDRLGFVFQAYNLLPHLTVAQNVTLPLLLAGRETDADWLTWLLHAVGLGELRERAPQELSGGQQQRAAIARALVTRPEVVFADEPTGALDTRTGRQVLDLLREMVTTLGQTVVMVTHDPVAAAVADRVLFLADGQLVGHLDQPDAHEVADRMTRLGEW